MERDQSTPKILKTDVSTHRKQYCLHDGRAKGRSESGRPCGGVHVIDADNTTEQQIIKELINRYLKFILN